VLSIIILYIFVRLSNTFSLSCEKTSLRVISDLELDLDEKFLNKERERERLKNEDNILEYIASIQKGIKRILFSYATGKTEE